MWRFHKERRFYIQNAEAVQIYLEGGGPWSLYMDVYLYIFEKKSFVILIRQP